MFKVPGFWPTARCWRLVRDFWGRFLGWVWGRRAGGFWKSSKFGWLSGMNTRNEDKSWLLSPWQSKHEASLEFWSRDLKKFCKDRLGQWSHGSTNRTCYQAAKYIFSSKNVAKAFDVGVGHRIKRKTSRNRSFWFIFFLPIGFFGAFFNPQTGAGGCLSCRCSTA